MLVEEVDVEIARTVYVAGEKLGRNESGTDGEMNRREQRQRDECVQRKNAMIGVSKMTFGLLINSCSIYLLIYRKGRKIVDFDVF